MFVVAAVLLCQLVHLGRTVPIKRAEAAELLELFQDLLFVPTIASTQADFDAYKAEGLFDVPVCPMKYRRFSCDANGSVDWLEIDARIDINADKYWHISTGAVEPVNFTVRNYFGLVKSLSLKASSQLVVENSVFIDVGSQSQFTTPWVFSAPNLVLTNVSLPLFDLKTISFYSPFESCRFTNVTLLCPVPAWIAVCFGANVTSANAPCLSSKPAIAKRFDDEVTLDADRVMCSPPPANVSACDFHALSRYLPAVPGFTVVDMLYRKRGEAERLFVDPSGVVARVDLWDWAASNWTRVIDRVPERTVSRKIEYLDMPPLVTNRVRVTLEQWTSEDAIMSLSLDLSFWPSPATPRPKKAPVCGDVTTLSARSTLDETLADSFCIDRVCQQACVNADNFTFGRPVRPLFLVVEGGVAWSGAKLAAMPSAETRVYELPAAEASNKTTAIGLNTNGVRRVRLVGAAVDGTLVPTVPERKGLNGLLIKWLELQRAAGATAVLNGTSAFDGKTSAKFVVDANVSVAVVLNSTFAFANGSLWQAERNGAADLEWTMVATAGGGLSRLLVNRGEPPARRVLVGLDDGLLAVVSASVHVHDGSVDQLLTNRLVQQMSIDVLNVRIGAWYSNILQHDISRNLSDIDVVQWNRTRFGVVDRASGRTSVIEYRAFPYTLVSCSSNRDCTSCIDNVANEETCRWCSARCVSRGSACMPNETSTISADHCDTSTTTTAIISATLSPTTLSPTTAFSVSTTGTTMVPISASADSSATVIGLAVGIPIAILVLLAAGLGVFFVLRNRRRTEHSETPTTPTTTPTEMSSTQPYQNVLPPDEENSNSLSITD